MTTALELVGNALILVGALVFATAALGVIRFPDAYTRASAIGTAGGVGIIFIVVGALTHQPTGADTVKVALIVALQLATSAVGTMAIARSAYLTRTRMHRPAYDDLGEYEDDPKSDSRASAD
ncbi:putative cation antiporter subunit [Leucobacter sp. Psy1]|uniref:cation:proton antiporter n=1 Tax=Leucobacter sp. Psy1 TaxID=2875729 RepID=UPI001CD3DAE1|nr:monovalent cation/H(+) antiporter subunit G [Leucobacter sp. Psy1]UBH05485.1 putative cation antiporter subunit [Leucobacter sp. Psy1]